MQGRTPLDLLSAQLAPAASGAAAHTVLEAFSWGHGANYQLGTGAINAQALPVRCARLWGRVVRTLDPESVGPAQTLNPRSFILHPKHCGSCLGMPACLLGRSRKAGVRQLQHWPVCAASASPVRTTLEPAGAAVCTTRPHLEPIPSCVSRLRSGLDLQRWPQPPCHPARRRAAETRFAGQRWSSTLRFDSTLKPARGGMRREPGRADAAPAAGWTCCTAAPCTLWPRPSFTAQR